MPRCGVVYTAVFLLRTRASRYRSQRRAALRRHDGVRFERVAFAATMRVAPNDGNDAGVPC
jgi:hypothetical protein